MTYAVGPRPASPHPLPCVPFVLSRPHGTATGTGEIASFDSPAAAVAALRRGQVSAVVGALPFSADHPSSLVAPATFELTTEPWIRPTDCADAPSGVRVDQNRAQNAHDHVRRVTSALRLLRDPSNPLRKVVLARSLSLTSETEVDPSALLSELVENTPSGNGFCVDLSAAGGRYIGRSMVGSSPEVLIRKQGRTVVAHPLAGSAPRFPDVERDRASGRALAESEKDSSEHRFVVDALREGLAPWCSAVTIPHAPRLTSTPQLWHLGTPITGTVRDDSVTALDIALALHPTPAVCGTPRHLAYEAIGELEGERGFYAGAVGWCGANGDGEWMVSIRCAEIDAGRKALTVYAGGGIVAESDPEAELHETDVKFGTMLSALIP